MEVEQWKVDKTNWDPGPWHDEPDRIDFEHAGLPCLILRSDITGALCGYAAVPPGHPAHGKGWNDGLDLNVHGGCTYFGACAGHICHVPKPGEPDDVWWFGFDCSHSGDLSPAMDARIRAYTPPESWAERAALKARVPFPFHESYKPVEYVRREVEELAEQLKRMA